MSSSLESGMFVKVEAWHKQGTVLAQAPTTPEAYLVSGLDWTVEGQPLYFRRNEEYRPTNKMALVRDSDVSVLGFASLDYTIFQNIHAFAWMDPLIQTGFWKYEAAGSLDGGKTCWGLLRHGDQEVIKGDLLKQYLLVNWGHDGQTSINVLPTSIRVVCQNTLRQALSSGKAAADIRKLKHTAQVHMKMEELKQYHLTLTNIFGNQVEKFKKMLDVKLKDIQIEEYIDKVFPLEDKRLSISKAAEVNGLAKEMAFGKASGLKELGIKNTLYSAFQASSETIEHYMSPKTKNRYDYVLFGKGATQLNEAWDFACDILPALEVPA